MQSSSLQSSLTNQKDVFFHTCVSHKLCIHSSDIKKSKKIVLNLKTQVTRWRERLFVQDAKRNIKFTFEQMRNFPKKIASKIEFLWRFDLGKKYWIKLKFFQGKERQIDGKNNLINMKINQKSLNYCFYWRFPLSVCVFDNKIY